MVKSNIGDADSDEDVLRLNNVQLTGYEAKDLVDWLSDHHDEIESEDQELSDTVDKLIGLIETVYNLAYSGTKEEGDRATIYIAADYVYDEVDPTEDGDDPEGEASPEPATS